MIQSEEFPIAQKISLIISSPMRRTLQTTQQGLGWLIARGVPVVLRPEWQENSAKPCDTGTAIEKMAKDFPDFDWSTVDPTYPAKTGLYAFNKKSLTQRGVEARKWLKERPEEVVAVVSHHGFLRVGASSCRYENADFRIFEFGPGQDGLELVQWEVTDKKGGGLGRSDKGHFPAVESDFVPRDGAPASAEAPQKDEAYGEVAKEKPTL